MFKAFTDNISSLIGAKDKEDGSKPASEGESKSSGEEAAVGDPGVKSPPEGESAATEVDKNDSKVPPPRPAPPSSSAAKPETPPSSPIQSTPSAAADDDVDPPETSEDTQTKKDAVDEKLEQVTEKAKAWGSKFILLLVFS